MKAAAVRSSILLFENDADLRNLLVEALTDDGGFIVRAAETIGEAQSLMVNYGESFAAAVLDVSLPDGDGRRFCTSLRRQGFHLPVIGVTP